MEIEKFDLLSVQKGLVEAPAGCGKTQLIIDTISQYSGDKPILVLTHTNAGVAALSLRLAKKGKQKNKIRISTIDGWAMKLVSTFPKRSGCEQKTLLLETPKDDYPIIRESTIHLLQSGCVNDIISSSYQHLIVDEYQDCSIQQHKIITDVSDLLPTCVLGDSLQAIFNFDGPLPNWKQEVCAVFPLTYELKTPWRWINSGSEDLGKWLIEVREALINGKPINLKLAPPSVKWVQLDWKNDYVIQLSTAKEKPTGVDDRILIIGDSKNAQSRFKFASAIPGATTIEAVDMNDFLVFAKSFNLEDPNAINQLIEFAENIMTNVKSMKLSDRIRSIQSKRSKKTINNIETAAISFINSPSFDLAHNFLLTISKTENVRNYRPIVFRACLKSLLICSNNPKASFYETSIITREQFRASGRLLPKRAVGSTLLVKGLESEISIVLNTDVLDPSNLYVALTRGSKKVIICSHSPILNPKKA